VSDPTDGIFISFVAPAHNERENLPALLEELSAAGRRIGRPWEVVLVDDGSDDGTAEALDDLMRRFPQLRVIALARRSGQTAALEAGLRGARGRLVGTLDADLQNDPAEFPRLIELLERAPCDMVTGWRKHRRDTGLRRLCSRAANWFRNRMTGERVHDAGCSLKVFRREVIDGFRLFDGLHRFLPALARMHGFRVREVAVHHRPRTAGRAKYGFWNRAFKATRDILALRWMQQRALRYRARELPRPDGQPPRR
jgi:glycosyltransferase involved in cell wall biosynthesis